MGATIYNLQHRLKLLLQSVAATKTPPAGELYIVADTDTGQVCQKDSTGNVISLAAMIQQDSVGFDPIVLYNFDTTTEGWFVSAEQTITWTALGGGSIDVVDNASSIKLLIRSPAGLTVNGAKYTRVKAMVTRLSGSGTFCKCLYTTVGHTFSESFVKTNVLPIELNTIGGTAVLDFDMANLTVGGTDWIDNTITQIRIDLGDIVGVGDSFRIHWAAIGRNAPVVGGSGVPSGSSTEVQYRSSGTFGANVDFTFDATNKVLAVPNILLDSALLDSTLPGALDLKTGAKKNALILPRHIDEFGAEYLSSPAFWNKNFSMFTPATGTTGTGLNLGGTWTSNGTVTHPNPANTNKGTIQHRTRYANVVTTQNQILGPLPTTPQLKFLRGHASAKMGGYLYHSRFVVEFPAATVRIFAGMNIAISGAHIQADTDIAGIMGFRHITTNPLSGAGAWNFYSNNGTANNTPINPSVALASGQLYEAWIYAPPGASDPVLYKLVLLEATANTVIVEGQIAESVAFTNLCCPQMLMSNGTANILVNTTANNICNITCVALN